MQKEPKVHPPDLAATLWDLNISPGFCVLLHNNKELHQLNRIHAVLKAIQAIVSHMQVRALTTEVNQVSSYVHLFLVRLGTDIWVFDLVQVPRRLWDKIFYLRIGCSLTYFSLFYDLAATELSTSMLQFLHYEREVPTGVFAFYNVGVLSGCHRDGLLVSDVATTIVESSLSFQIMPKGVGSYLGIHREGSKWIHAGAKIQINVVRDVHEDAEPAGTSPGPQITHEKKLGMCVIKHPKVHPPDVGIPLEDESVTDFVTFVSTSNHDIVEMTSDLSVERSNSIDGRRTVNSNLVHVTFVASSFGMAVAMDAFEVYVYPVDVMPPAMVFQLWVQLMTPYATIASKDVLYVCSPKLNQDIHIYHMFGLPSNGNDTVPIVPASVFELHSVEVTLDCHNDGLQEPEIFTCFEGHKNVQSLFVFYGTLYWPLGTDSRRDIHVMAVSTTASSVHKYQPLVLVPHLLLSLDEYLLSLATYDLFTIQGDIPDTTYVNAQFFRVFKVYLQLISLHGLQFSAAKDSFLIHCKFFVVDRGTHQYAFHIVASTYFATMKDFSEGDKRNTKVGIYSFQMGYSQPQVLATLLNLGVFNLRYTKTAVRSITCFDLEGLLAPCISQDDVTGLRNIAATSVWVIGQVYKTNSSCYFHTIEVHECGNFSLDSVTCFFLSSCKVIDYTVVFPNCFMSHTIMMLVTRSMGSIYKTCGAPLCLITTISLRDMVRLVSGILYTAISEFLQVLLLLWSTGWWYSLFAEDYHSQLCLIQFSGKEILPAFQWRRNWDGYSSYAIRMPHGGALVFFLWRLAWTMIPLVRAMVLRGSLDITMSDINTSLLAVRILYQMSWSPLSQDVVKYLLFMVWPSFDDSQEGSLPGISVTVSRMLWLTDYFVWFALHTLYFQLKHYNYCPRMASLKQAHFYQPWYTTGYIGIGVFMTTLSESFPLTSANAWSLGSGSIPCLHTVAVLFLGHMYRSLSRGSSHSQMFYLRALCTSSNI